MGKQYYLVSQLPDISACTTNSALPITQKYYRDLCSRFLDKRDLATLDTLSIEAPKAITDTGSFFLNKWYEYDRCLRFALAQVRAAKLKKDVGMLPVSCTQDIVQTARTAVNMDSPLSAEMFLYEKKLSVLNDLQPLDYFCADYVFCYGMRLLLLERMKKFDKIRGQDSYKEIYGSILQGADK